MHGEIPALLGCGFGLLMLTLVSIVGLVIGVFVCYQLYLAAGALPEGDRKLAPASVFLLLVPVVNVIWLFFVVLRLSEGYRQYFAAHPRVGVGDCGQMLGIGWAVATAAIFLPLLHVLAPLAALVLMVLYLVKMSDLRGLLTRPPEA